jgi:hypothetical protein
VYFAICIIYYTIGTQWLQYAVLNTLIMATSIIPIEHAQRFILSGNATLIVFNTKTGNHRKYRIWEKSDNTFYVYHDDNYLGKIVYYIFSPHYKAMEPGYAYLREVQGFIRVWDWVTRLSLPEHVQLLHTGVCGYCGRLLTDPDSIQQGLGPVCRKKLETKYPHLNHQP